MSPKATIDTSLLFQIVGDDETEDNGVKSEEEGYLAYGAQVNLYIDLGSGLSLIFGGAFFAAEDHEVDTANKTELRDSVTYVLQAGVHYYFGGSSGSKPGAPGRRR